MAVAVGAFGQGEDSDELARLRDTLQRTERALADAKAESAELTQALRTARADTAALQARAAAAEGTSVQMVRARDEATRQAAELRTALAQALREAAAARSQTPEGFEKLTQEVLSLREALAAQEQANRDLRDARVRLENELAAAEQRRTAAEAAAAEALQRADMLGAELERVRADISNVERQRDEDRARASVELADLRKRLETLESEGRLSADQSRRLAADQAALREEAEQHVIALGRELAASREAALRLEETNRGLEREHADLVRQLEVARAEAARAAAALPPARSGPDEARVLERVEQMAEPKQAPAVRRDPAPPVVATAKAASVSAPVPTVPIRTTLRAAPTRPDGRLTAVVAAPRTHALRSSGTRTHIVARGDTLTRISQRYFGTARRWSDIYEANRDILSQSNGPEPGQRLVLP